MRYLTLAMLIFASPTGTTETTGRKGVDDDRIADGDRPDIGADFMDPAGVLLTGHERPAGDPVVPVTGEDMEIGAADTGAADSDDDVRWPRDGRLPDLFDGQRQVAGGTESRGLHRGT